MYCPNPVRLFGVALLVSLLAGCGNSDTPGVGTVTVTNLADGQQLICGQAGGQGQGSTFNILGSGFLSEHGVDVTVVFTAVMGTPFEGGTSATVEAPGQVITDNLIVAQLPNFGGTVIVTLTVILPGGNAGVSLPGEVTIGGFLDGPYAFSDRYEGPADMNVAVAAPEGVLVNDFGRQCIRDSEPGPQMSPPSVTGFTIDSYESMTQSGGTVMMDPDGAFLYTPPNGFEGVDRFNYTMNDQGFTSSATVFLTIGSINTKPSAR